MKDELWDSIRVLEEKLSIINKQLYELEQELEIIREMLEE